MFKEFCQTMGKKEIAEKMTLPELGREIVTTFDSMVDLLRNPDLFPNKHTNQLITLMWKLIGGKRISVVLDQWGIPSVSFAVIDKDQNKLPILIIPQDFLNQVKESPEAQLGAMVYMGSQCRDAYTNRITGSNSHEINVRAQMYEADALITMSGLATEEGYALKLLPFQHELLAKFPNGLAQASPEIAYPNPIYPPNDMVGFKWN